MEQSAPFSARQPRFLCDAMLGSLARWLRFFGFDALYLEPGAADQELAGRALEEHRWLLTRDRDLAATGPRTVLLRGEDLEDQLVEVFGRLGLQPDASLEDARCGECNGRLVEVTRSEVESAVPPHVLSTAPRFRRCGACGRVYWPGSHGRRIVDKMQRVISRLGAREG